MSFNDLLMFLIYGLYTLGKSQVFRSNNRPLLYNNQIQLNGQQQKETMGESPKVENILFFSSSDSTAYVHHGHYTSGIECEGVVQLGIRNVDRDPSW